MKVFLQRLMALFLTGAFILSAFASIIPTAQAQTNTLPAVTATSIFLRMGYTALNVENALYASSSVRITAMSSDIYIPKSNDAFTFRLRNYTIPEGSSWNQSMTSVPTNPSQS